MKVALVQSPVWGTYDPPIALAQLSSCLKREGNEVCLFDLNIKLYLNRNGNYRNMWAWEQSLFWYDSDQVAKFFRDNKEDIERYAEDIVNTGAEIIGISVNAASRLSSIEFARQLKRKDNRLRIIFGGPLFFERKFIDSILNEGCVDIVISGEGESTFSELVSLIESNQDIDLCRGISFKKNGKVLYTGPRELLKGLDELPFLDFTDLALDNYDDSRHIPFMASRGCIQRCVFCSSRAFWPGYRAMSGERIFREIEFHKRQQAKSNPDFGHVDFLDLLFNGSMKSLIDFCELMSKVSMDVYWTANMIIRREMDLEVIKKMKAAGCEHIIFGIESGSQRVLDLMEKHYRIEDADRIVQWMHNAGIIVTCNFMFGFPGETEGDFRMTLDFMKRNSRFLDRVYPSRTYCAIEEPSYFNSHLEEFGIKPNPPNHLYWETLDGGNNYPMRLERCREFCDLAVSLGIEVGCGVQTSLELDKWYNLGFYYEYRKDYKYALDCFLRYNKLDSANELVSNKINFYHKKLENIDSMTEREGDNSRLNDEEFETQRIILKSSPKTFFLQAAGPCNSYCVFCSRGEGYEFFDLGAYRERFEKKLNCFLQKAEQIILTGSGELLLLPDAEEILNYFDNNFPRAEKVFSTNGSPLNPAISERIAASKSKYTLHISLHASNSKLHNILTRSDNFQKIISQLNYLLKLRDNTGNPTIHLIFVATTLNIEDLPDFVRLAADLGADKVICYYNYIYIPGQKYLSCFFKQQLTNRMLDEAEKAACNTNIKIELPPRFALKSYTVNNSICREPWSQIMLNARGDILPCDASEDTNETLDGKDFMDVWNGTYYQNLRRSLAGEDCPCFRHCFRANPISINDFRSHVIHRGRQGSQINILWGDNF